MSATAAIKEIWLNQAFRIKHSVALPQALMQWGGE